MKKRINNDKVRGSFSWEGEIIDELAQETEGFVGAEIENVVVAAIFEAFSEKRSVQREDFQKAIANTVPLAVTQAEQIKGIREWANVRAVAATAQEDRRDYVQEDQQAADPSARLKRESGDVFQQRGGRTIDF